MDNEQDFNASRRYSMRAFVIIIYSQMPYLISDNSFLLSLFYKDICALSCTNLHAVNLIKDQCVFFSDREREGERESCYLSKMEEEHIKKILIV